MKKGDLFVFFSNNYNSRFFEKEENMRLTFRQILKGFVLFVFLLSLGSPILTQPGVPQLEGIEEMYRFALDQLPRILEFIPMNEEEKYGFKSREEFKIADLGIPYQEYSLDKDMPTGYWRIPVTVNNENRALLRLKKQNGKWVFSGFGAARLATELGFFENHIAATKPSWGRIVRDFEMNCDYLQFEPGSEAKLEGVIHPMESAARIMLRSRDSIDKRGYTVTEIKEFRLQLKRMPRGTTPGKAK
jgi:hypothetical protein